ncbi:MAG: bifunctional 3-(3-hydroxy-phenyl)propionate/3-hydroxycinnamic acid hydroxylase [Actinomycetes bacterium]
MNAAGIHDVEVAVIGYGPVGTVLTGLLAQRGVRVAAFERGADVFTLPRAAHFDAEIARVFQQLGAMDAILPATKATSGMDFVDAEDRVLMSFEAEDHEIAEGWPRSFMFYQPDVERALRSRVAELPSAQVHLEHEVLTIDDRGDGVAVVVRDLCTGAERTVTAAYAVGCDGARSLVRAAMGATLEDLVFDQPWLVVDVMLRGGAELPTRPTQYCTPARPATFIPSAGDHRRWEFMLLPGETAESMETPERIRDLIGPWIDPDRVEVIRSAVYSFHALIATGWRAGRLLLAGDAAHQMPPFLGQGMCAGIRDAANLEWKLTRVLRGSSDPAILDTYETERAPHVRSFIETAVAAGRIIQTTDPEEAAMRDAFLLDRTNDRPPTPTVPPIGPGLGDPADPLRTERIPQPIDGSGTRRDDLLGDDVVLVVDPIAWSSLAPEDRARAGRLPVVDAELTVPWLRAHGLVAAIVRPDRHVLASATTAAAVPAMVEGCVRELAGVGG